MHNLANLHCTFSCSAWRRHVWVCCCSIDLHTQRKPVVCQCLG